MKRLTLNLRYRGKPLSYVRQGVDFGRRLCVGASPALFWQVLAQGFPQCHTLLQRQGEGYMLRTRREWRLEVAGQQAQGDVLLRPGDAGTLLLAPQWEVVFGWEEEAPRVPTMAELALRRQYARRAPLSAEQRFTRVFLLLALLATAVGIVVASALQPTPVQAETLVQRYMQAPRAQLVLVEPQPGAPDDYSARTDDSPQPAAPPARPGEPGPASLDDFFGFDPAAVPGAKLGSTSLGAQDLLRVDTGAAISTTAEGAHALKTGEATAWFDVHAREADVLQETDGEGALRTIDLTMGKDGVPLERVDLDELGASAGSYNLVRLEAGNMVRPAVQQRFAGLDAVAEEELEVSAGAAGARGDLTSLRQSVRTYRRQIETLFRAENAVSPMHGTLVVTLFIATDGTVQDAALQPEAGSLFGERFLQRAHDVILAWHLPVTQDTVYQFRITFMQ